MASTVTTDPPDSDQSKGIAAGKAFAVAELFENIMLEVGDPPTIVGAERVSKEWRARIRGFNKIQTALFRTSKPEINVVVDPSTCALPTPSVTIPAWIALPISVCSELFASNRSLVGSFRNDGYGPFADVHIPGRDVVPWGSRREGISQKPFGDDMATIFPGDSRHTLVFTEGVGEDLELEIDSLDMMASWTQEYLIYPLRPIDIELEFHFPGRIQSSTSQEEHNSPNGADCSSL